MDRSCYQKILVVDVSDTVHLDNEEFVKRGFHKGPSSLEITTKKRQTRNSRKRSSVIQIEIS